MLNIFLAVHIFNSVCTAIYYKKYGKKYNLNIDMANGFNS